MHSFRHPGVPPFDQKIFFKKKFPPPADVRPTLIGSQRNDHQNSIRHPSSHPLLPPAAPFSEPLYEARTVLFRAEKSASLSAMKFPPPSLFIQGKRRNPSPDEDLFVKIGAGAFNTLTIPPSPMSFSAPGKSKLGAVASSGSSLPAAKRKPPSRASPSSPLASRPNFPLRRLVCRPSMPPSPSHGPSRGPSHGTSHR